MIHFLIALVICSPLILVLFVGTLKDRNESRKCSSCYGTGQTSESTRLYCNYCDGTGQSKVNTYDLENNEYKKIFSRDSDGFREKCFSCHGDGYTFITSSPKTCLSCNGTGRK